MNISEVTSPEVITNLELIRDREIDLVDFRKAITEIAIALSKTATKDVANQKNIIAIPILRAGLGLLPGFLEVIPATEVGFLGMKRDEKNLVSKTYMNRIPKDLSQREVFLLDPMLATGGSLSESLKILFQNGAKSVKVISIVVAPEGIARINKDFADANIKLYCAKIDAGLDDSGYIVPGIGDAGDRLFGKY